MFAFMNVYNVTDRFRKEEKLAGHGDPMLADLKIPTATGFHLVASMVALRIAGFYRFIQVQDGFLLGYFFLLLFYIKDRSQMPSML